MPNDKNANNYPPIILFIGHFSLAFNHLAFLLLAFVPFDIFTNDIFTICWPFYHVACLPMTVLPYNDAGFVSTGACNL